MVPIRETLPPAARIFLLVSLVQTKLTPRTETNFSIVGSGTLACSRIMISDSDRAVPVGTATSESWARTGARLRPQNITHTARRRLREALIINLQNPP